MRATNICLVTGTGPDGQIIEPWTTARAAMRKHIPNHSYNIFARHLRERGEYEYKSLALNLKFRVLEVKR